MKKFIFSASFALFYVAYIIYQRGHMPATNLVLPPLQIQNSVSQPQALNTLSAGSADPPAPGANQALALNPPAATASQPQTSPKNQQFQPQPATPKPSPTQTQTTPQPSQAPQPTPSPAPTPAGQYKNGAYIGSSVDAFYGFVQVQVTISNGQISDVQFLSYPGDRSTSRQINSQAMPYLIQEAIAAQSANVNIVSGATDTSVAFQQSLASALSQAKI